jgi:hypothetical protein
MRYQCCSEGQINQQTRKEVVHLLYITWNFEGPTFNPYHLLSHSTEAFHNSTDSSTGSGSVVPVYVILPYIGYCL